MSMSAQLLIGRHLAKIDGIKVAKYDGNELRIQHVHEVSKQHRNIKKIVSETRVTGF